MNNFIWKGNVPICGRLLEKVVLCFIEKLLNWFKKRTVGTLKTLGHMYNKDCWMFEQLNFLSYCFCQSFGSFVVIVFVAPKNCL